VAGNRNPFEQQLGAGNLGYMYDGYYNPAREQYESMRQKALYEKALYEQEINSRKMTSLKSVIEEEWRGQEAAKPPKKALRKLLLVLK